MSAKPAFSSALLKTDPVCLLTWGYMIALGIIAVMSLSVHMIINDIVTEQDRLALSLGQSAGFTSQTYIALTEKIRQLQDFQRMAALVICVTLVAEALLIFAPLVRRVRDYAAELKILTMTDLLTGIGNRRFFIFRGNQEVQRCRRLKKDLCLAVIDLDHFKYINDNYGHKSGDMVLQQFVNIAGQIIRYEDIFARLGGEEFAILLPHTTPEDAMRIMDRMRGCVAETNFKIDSEHATCKMTISVGFTKVNLAREEFETALVLADVALYDAKRAGRNKVIYKEAENFFEKDESPRNVISFKSG